MFPLQEHVAIGRFPEHYGVPDRQYGCPGNGDETVSSNDSDYSFVRHEKRLLVQELEVVKYV